MWNPHKFDGFNWNFLSFFRFYLIASYVCLSVAMKAHKPTDATTNPSLILSAAQQEQYQHLIERAVKHGNKTGT